MGQIDIQSKFRTLHEVVRDVLVQLDTDSNFIQERLHLFEIELESGKLGVDRLEQSIESTILLTQAFFNWVNEQRQTQPTSLQGGLQVASIQLTGTDGVGFQQNAVNVELQTSQFTTQQEVLVALSSYADHVQFRIDNVLHNVAETPEEPQNRTCGICFKEFTNTSKLKKHMSLLHANAKLHKCKLCDERFPSLRALKVHHRKDHAGIMQKEEAECNVLEGNIEAASQQEELQQCQEMWQQNLTCNVCGKKFSMPRRLKYHQKIHQDVGEYQCDICGKEFKIAKYLREHMRTHSAEKPYVCKYCGRGFKSWGSRYCHYKVHKNTKVYSCEHCDKTFIRADGLKRHLVVHSKNKPFSCEFCRKPFTLKNSLIAHVEKVHASSPTVSQSDRTEESESAK